MGNIFLIMSKYELAQSLLGGEIMKIYLDNYNEDCVIETTNLDNTEGIAPDGTRFVLVKFAINETWQDEWGRAWSRLRGRRGQNE